MANEEGWTRKEAAQHFGVSVNTIRGWQTKYKKWLHVDAAAFKGGVNKPVIYDEHDMLVFRLVQEGTREGRTHAQIQEKLDDDLAIAPDFSADEEQPQASDETALVPWQQYSTVVAQLTGTEGKLEAVTDERDYLRERIDKLEERLEETQEKLNEERARSWWQRLRGR